MNVIKLNKKNPTIEFDLNAEESYLLIESICITTNNDCSDQWANFISKVKLSAELRYFSFRDAEGRFIDERKKQFPIHIMPGPYQAQPFFPLNKSIKNETFTVGINPEQQFYQALKLELHDIHELEIITRCNSILNYLNESQHIRKTALQPQMGKIVQFHARGFELVRC